MAHSPTLFRISIFMISLFLATPAGSGRAADNKLSVFTSLAPVAYVVAEIGGDLVEVETLLPPGRDPHSFSPTPQQIVALSEASIYFTANMPFENELLRRLAHRQQNLQVIDCSAGVHKLAMAHDHHHDVDSDPHIWLGIEPLATMATNISHALSQAAPAHRQTFSVNLQQFEKRLQILNRQLRQRLSPFRGRGFLVFHPSFGYFAASFGLVQHAVEVDGKSPSPRQLAEIIKMARAEQIKIIFVQPQFDKRAANRIAQAIGGRTLTLDPLAADVFANLRQMAEKIAPALAK